jgi:GDP-4-dehydro-6-deoxy-D-mannose reductase
LRAEGLEVVATARTADPAHGWEACDLTDARQVEGLISRIRPDWVYQCAGATRTSNPHEQYRLHVEGTLAVLSAVARHTPSAPVALLGSASEYGPVDPEALPVREDYPAQPLSFFGASKLAQTQLARAAAAEWGLSVLVARPFNIIGPGLPLHYFAASFADRLLQDKAQGASGEIAVTNGSATRDFVDVRDVALALIGLVMRVTPSAGTAAVYNIASGQETPMLAVAEKLCALAGGFSAVDGGAGQSRSNITRSCGDAGKLQQAIAWAPRIAWDQSITDLWHAMPSR